MTFFENSSLTQIWKLELLSAAGTLNDRYDTTCFGLGLSMDSVDRLSDTCQPQREGAIE